jgi:NAD(P)-dependent dehydrogenase (short-subunit alcohol dehydrogenase family)
MSFARVRGLTSNSTTTGWTTRNASESTMVTLASKNVVIVGASRGVGRAIARRMAAEGAHVLAVGRKHASLEQLARELPGTKTLALDAAAEAAPASVFAALRPDLLVLCGGAKPPGRPIHELSWEEFAVNWETDVRISFSFCREALRLPLPPGATVIVISSGAALGGSPISGGYAGAKRTQMFIANYAQKESERLKLGVRFFALAPARIMPDTELGRFAVESYARYLGISPVEFVEGMSSRQTPEDVANATAKLATHLADYPGSVFTISGEGIAPA